METAAGTWSCAEGLRRHFENAGLATFEDWMALRAVPFREISMRPHRPVVVIEIPGISVPLFVKRNLDPSRPKTLSETLRLRSTRSEARRELNQLRAFTIAGVSVPEPVAWGEGIWENLPRTSFLVTKDLRSLPLERYLFHHWGAPLDGAAAADKRSVLSELAHLTRRMHDSGLVHRDFYFGHVFVREGTQPGDSKLSVIDVQRASHRPTWWIRPRIKDLASLHFSADPRYIRPSDRLRFLKEYWNVDRLSGWQKLQIAWILRKAERIRKHTEKALGVPYSDYFKNKYY